MHRSVTQKLIAVILACAPVLFTGCDLPLDFWDEKTVTIDIPAGGPTVFPNQNANVDLSGDPAIASHLNAIQSITVPEVWIQVGTIYSDNAATNVSGNMTISDPTDSTWTPIVLTYTNVPIAAGGQLNITPNPDDVTRLQTLIQTKQKFDVVYGGSIDQLPAHFDLTGRIHITAVVST